MKALLRNTVDRLFIKQPRLREAVTVALYGRGDCDVMLMGLNIRINRLRENGYLRAAGKSRLSSFLAHEIHVANVLAMLAHRASIFVDAGANVGVFSSLMASYGKLAPGYRVMAFEPNPDTYLRLAENGRRHGFETYPLALSDADTRKTFVDGAVSHVFTAVEHANAYNIPSRRRDIDCRRLDGLVPADAAIFLKVDTEGQEYDVLKGAEALFAQGRVAGVYLDGHDPAKVPPFLLKHGFELRDIDTLHPDDGSAYGLLALKPVHEAGRAS